MGASGNTTELNLPAVARRLTAGSAFDYPANAARAADDPAWLVAVDFISGAGQADFERCDIVSLDRGSHTNDGYVTAPSTSRSQPCASVIALTRLRRLVLRGWTPVLSLSGVER